jgi:hypothetical protein
MEHAMNKRLLAAVVLIGLLFVFTSSSLEVDPGVVHATLTASVEGNVVPRSFENDIETTISGLKAVRTEAIVDGSDGQTTPVGTVAHSVLSSSAARERFVRLYSENMSPDVFWAAVKKDNVLRKRLGALRFASDVVNLVGAHPPLVRELVRRHDAGDLASVDDLAGYDETSWSKLLTKGKTPVGAPEDTPGRTASDRTRNFAETLTQTVAGAYPTASIRAGIESAGGDARVGGFLKKHPAFSFGEDTVDGYIARNAPKTPDATVAELKDVERLSKITKNYGHMRALRDAGLGSSRAIARTGKKVFTEEYAKDFGGRVAAEAAWERAAWLAAAAQHVVAASAPIFQVPLAVLPERKLEDNPSLPDWEKLFGSIELCECEQCRTVVSPAAYITDILHFLDERAPSAGATPLRVMFRRRGDIGEIELTCENTNTPLPYIDLVNEVLERAIAPQSFRIQSTLAQLNAGNLSNQGVLDFAAAGFPLADPWQVGAVRQNELWWVRSKGWRFVLTWNATANAFDVVPYPQTSGTASELAANPEHVNDAAYAKLAAGVYPWSLPFDLPLEQVAAFTARMGLTRDELMRRYQPTGAQPTPSNTAIAGAAIGLGDAERRIIAGSHPSSPHPWRFWGVTGVKQGPHGGLTDWSRQLQPIRVLLDRARIDYGHLMDLLELVFINPTLALRRLSCGTN